MDPVHDPGAPVRHEQPAAPVDQEHHTGRTRYQVVLWKDQTDLYDLARHGEPMVPTYSVPGLRKQS